MKGKRQIVTIEYTYDCIEYVYVDLRVLIVKDYIFMIHQYLFKKKKACIYISGYQYM